MASRNGKLNIALVLDRRSKFPLNGAAEGKLGEEVYDITTLSERKLIYQVLAHSGHLVSVIEFRNFSTDLKRLMELQPDIVINLYAPLGQASANSTHLSALWELMNIPYSGSSTLTLGIARHKPTLKRMLDSRRIATPEFQVYSQVPQVSLVSSPVTVRGSLEDFWPGDEGRRPLLRFEEIQKMTEKMLARTSSPVLVEHVIEGREFLVCVLGNEKPSTLPVCELRHSAHAYVEADVRGGSGSGWRIDEPRLSFNTNLGNEMQFKLCDIALRVYRTMLARDYAMVDIKVDAEDHYYVMDFYPCPDTSEGSVFNLALEHAGIKYKAFVQNVVQQTRMRKIS